MKLQQMTPGWFALLIAGLLAQGGIACSFDPTGDALLDATPDPLDAPGVDATPDPIDAPSFDCSAWSPRPAHFDPCAIAEPSMGLELTDTGTYVYNTETGVLLDPDMVESNPNSTPLIPPAAEPRVRVLSVDRLLVGSDTTLRVEGAHPLIVAAWTDIVIAGTVDVSSNAADGPGAGANTGTCMAADPGGPQMNNGGGGGGGGGGGLQSPGGNGGDGDGGGGSPGTKGDPVDTPDNVRGGCPGAKGGAGDGVDGGGGLGGDGGGAIQLTAHSRIQLRGTVHAGGAGGAGADADTNGHDRTRRSGGGGGGSGGYIGLEGATLMLMSGGVLAANGGGGGGGCGNGAAQPGQDGKPGEEQANGGSGQQGGGVGGAGGWRENLDGGDGDDGPNDRGGGGGGGGTGYIILRGTVDGSGVSTSPEPIEP